MRRPLGLAENGGPMADPARSDRLSIRLAGCQLHRQVADGGAFWMAYLDGPLGALPGQLREEFVAAGSSENMDTIEPAAEKIFQAG